eukprot:SAG31_NODE_6712_length_1916_cov_1.376445_2_plen_124_part_00
MISSADDDALAVLMESIRWSAQPAPVVIHMNGLDMGGNYRLQLLFHEKCCDRGFDISVAGTTIVDDYSPQREQGGLQGGGRPGAVITYDFVAATTSVTVTLSGRDNAFADNNPILNAFTLEHL